MAFPKGQAWIGVVPRAENPINRGAWQATVHRAAKSWTQLSTHKGTASLQVPRGQVLHLLFMNAYLA